MPEPILQVRDLVKRYDQVVAVDHLSLDVNEGEIFGLLGPNGAGKTTTIRIIMDIFKADEGHVPVLGRDPGKASGLIGYLPEERGLYTKRKVLDCLVYLARLKGMSKPDAIASAGRWLKTLGLAEWAQRRVQDLSRGMQQKIQFIASCVHNPKLLVLDEPFQGLDPVNVEVIRNLMQQLRQNGTTLVLSAHEMNRVEELCDRIAIINHGQRVLYGHLREIQEQYGSNIIRLQTPAELGELEGVTKVERRNQEYLLQIGNTDPQMILAQLVSRGVQIDFFETGSAPLEQIFINVVTGGQQHV